MYGSGTMAPKEPTLPAAKVNPFGHGATICLLDHVHAMIRGAAAGFGAGFANAVDDQAMAGDAETMVAGDLIAEGDQFRALELEQLVALSAVEMVVLGIAIIVLVDTTAIEHELA